jgi:tetratricopeptide (TPR) repeat protein
LKNCYAAGVNDLTIGLLGALLATNQPLAVSSVIHAHTGVAIEVAADPTAQELRDVMLDDDAAQDTVNAWISAYQAQPGTNRTTAAGVELDRRIRERLDGVRGRYEHFLKNHPDNARGYLAYGSFLNDIGDEEGAHLQYENSRQLDPKNPAVWNNLANYYGEFSPQSKAFEYYEQAIKLNPNEPVYYQNFATTVYLFRRDAREYFHCDEAHVFDRALDLYRRAMALAPENLVLATDYATSYYGIKPLRTNDALAAWTNALARCQDENEREGVQLHLARVKIAAGYFAEASNHLAVVTNAAFADLKNRLYRSLLDHKNGATNEVPGATNLPAKIPALAVPATDIIEPATLVSSNLLVAPPPVRESKPQ